MKLTAKQKVIYDNLIDVGYFDTPHYFLITRVHKRILKFDKNIRVHKIERVIEIVKQSRQDV